MTADSIHVNIAQAQKKTENIIYITDLIELIEKYNKYIKAIKLNIGDFYQFNDGKRQRKKGTSTCEESMIDVKVLMLSLEKEAIFYLDSHKNKTFKMLNFRTQHSLQ